MVGDARRPALHLKQPSAIQGRCSCNAFKAAASRPSKMFTAPCTQSTCRQTARRYLLNTLLPDRCSRGVVAHASLSTAEAHPNFEHRVLPEKRRYGVIGSGALGAFYGCKLQAAGCEVHFLVNRDFDHVRQHGFKVKSVDGDFELPEVFAYQSVTDMPKCDVVVLALKTTSNHLLHTLLPPILKPSGVVLVLQNGIGIESQVAELVGSDSVVGGGCLLCSNKTAPGHIHHIDYGNILLADFMDQYAPCGITPRVQQLAEDFTLAGVPVVQEEDLFIARWKKLVWNIPFNGPSMLLNASTDAIMGSPHLRLMARELMDEVVEAAVGSASHLTPHLPPRTIPLSFVEYIIDFTDNMRPYKTSMLLDYEGGRPMEVEALYGEPLRLAQQAGVDTPRIATLYKQLKFVDERNMKQHALGRTVMSTA